MINHAVQLVGYGTDDDLGDYWLVRNSWADDWGEDGFIRLRREPEEEVTGGGKRAERQSCHVGHGGLLLA